MSFASNATGVKNLAVGAGILVGGAVAVYLGYKLFKGGAAATGYLFGTSNDKSLGTDIYNMLNPSESATAGPDDVAKYTANPSTAPSWWDADQAAKTRASL